MTEKVLCPYCGTEMVLVSRIRDGSYAAWYKCYDCNTTSPRAYDCKSAIEADRKARVISLRRYQPENRVLSLDEVKAYIADTHDVQSLYMDFPNEHEFTVHWRSGDSLWQVITNSAPSYGRRWRCWLRKPTEEERKAVPWDE